MRTIPLSRGYVALVDDEDYARVAHHRYWAAPNGRTIYALRSTRHPDGRRTTVGLHKDILASPGLETDHINGDGLDNRRRNLRLATHAENSRNRKPHGGLSAFKGVYPADGKWVAQVRVNGRRHYLGAFASQDEAAAAYDQAARRHFGIYALTNDEMARRGVLPVVRFPGSTLVRVSSKRLEAWIARGGAQS